MILNHRPPLQLVRLLATLRDQDSSASLVVHHDQFRFDIEALRIPDELGVQLLTSPGPIRWGDFSLVDAYWRTLTWLVEHVEFDWVVLLSAQDYPIKPLSQLHQLLESTEADALIEAMPVAEITIPHDLVDVNFRYNYRYATPSKLRTERHLPPAVHSRARAASAFFIDRINNRQPFVHMYRFPDPQPTRFGVRSRSTPFTPTFPCWYGSGWPALNFAAVETVVPYASENGEFVSYYRSVIIPDESVTATLVGNDPDLELVRVGLHHVRWSDGVSGHPDVFRESDLEELSRSSHVFARKFDADLDSVILDRLDALLAQG